MFPEQQLLSMLTRINAVYSRDLALDPERLEHVKDQIEAKKAELVGSDGFVWGPCLLIAKNRSK